MSIIKVMTYNIASGWNNDPQNRVRDFAFAADEIAVQSPDICGLNEVGKRLPDGIPSHCDYIGDRVGMDRRFSKAIETEGFPYGNAMVTKYRVLSHRTVMIPDPPKTEDAYYETRCILVCELEAPGLGPVSLLVSHFGLADGEKVNAVAAVCDEIDRIRRDHPGRQIILMGDFNMTPGDARLDAVRERLTEASRALGKEEPTFPSNAPRIKIDYIFASERLKPVACAVPDTLSSDHCPMTALLEIAEG